MQKILDDTADFAWSYGQTFFVETKCNGNFVWSDPDYDGDNTLTKFNGNYGDWIKQIGIPFARCKGKHVVKHYCGEEVKIIL